MPGLEYFVVCESVSTDKDTNRVSLFNIVEEINFHRQTDQPPRNGIPVVQFVAVSCWNRLPEDEGNDFQAMLRIHPTVPEVEAAEFPLNFTMENRRQRLLMRIAGIPEMPAGDLRFELLLNGDHAATHTVTFSEAPQNAAE